MRFSAVSIRVLPLPAVELRDLQVAEDPKFGTEPFLKLDIGRVRLRLCRCWRAASSWVTSCCESRSSRSSRPPMVGLNIASLGAATEPRPGGRPAGALGRRGRRGEPGGGRPRRGGRRHRRVCRPWQGRGGLAQYRLTDADVTLTGSGTQITFKGTTRLQPGDVRLALSDGVVALANGKSLSEASLRGKVAVDGKDVGPLAGAAIGPEPGALGGGLKGALVLGGTVAAPTATGEVTIRARGRPGRIPSVRSPSGRMLTVASLKMNTAWQDQRLTGRPVTADISGGAVTTQLTVALDRGVRVQLADVGIKTLPLEKVVVDYLCLGYAITGPLDLTGELTFDGHDMLNTLSGPGQLHVGRGKVVGSQALALFASLVRVSGAVSSVLAADVPNACPRRAAGVRLDHRNLRADQRGGHDTRSAVHEPVDEGLDRRGLLAADAADEPGHDRPARPRRAEGQGERHRLLALDQRLAGQRAAGCRSEEGGKGYPRPSQALRPLALARRRRVAWAGRGEQGPLRFRERRPGAPRHGRSLSCVWPYTIEANGTAGDPVAPPRPRHAPSSRTTDGTSVQRALLAMRGIGWR